MMIPSRPDQMALLLIDVQKYVLDPQKHPPRAEFYERANNVVIPNLLRLLSHARTIGVEVLYTVMMSLTKDGRDRSLDYKLSGFNLPFGSAKDEVAAIVAPIGDEMVLPKTSACLFHSTSFDYILRNLGVETILCTGFLTDQCVEQTMKSGASRGYQMICVTDACAANTREKHYAALDRISPFGWLKQTDEIIF